MLESHVLLASKGWVLSRIDPRADSIAYWEDPESGIVFDTDTALRIAAGQDFNAMTQESRVGLDFSFVA